MEIREKIRTGGTGWNEPASSKIGDHSIGPGQSSLVIAELGVNHNGDVRDGERLRRAMDEVDIVVSAADAPESQGR